MKKIIFLILLSQLCFAIDYDEEITTGQKLYFTTQSFKKKTYKLVKENNDYVEIYNFYSKLTIMKGDTEIIKLENSNEEESYYFKYDSNSIYYIIFEFPTSSFNICGFKVSSSEEEYNLLTSKLYLYFAKKREFTLKIKNTENTPQIIELELYMDQYAAFESSKAQENGITFIPNYSQESYFSSRWVKFNLILNDELIFMPIIKYPYTQISQLNFASITLTYKNDNVISKNFTKCLSQGNFEYYKLNYPNDKLYCETSFSKNTLLYNIKSNTNLNKITEITSFSNNQLSFLMINATEYQGCFSVIFKDKDNKINEDQDFNLTLFDARSYDVLFTQPKNYIQIKYQINEFYNLTLSTTNQKLISYSYFYPNDKSYVFLFEKTSDEFKVQFNFEQISVPTNDYYVVNISYNGIDKDLVRNNINSDSFKCVDTATHYRIQTNSEKPFIFLLTNETTKVALEDKSLEEINSLVNFYKIDRNKDFGIFPSKNEIICFDLMYQTKEDMFTLKPKQKLNFHLVSPNYFIINLINLKKGCKITFEIKSEKKNINIGKIYIDNKEYSSGNKIEFTADKEEAELELPITLNNNKIIDVMTIYFHQLEYEWLIKFASYCAYACFGIILLPLVLVLFCQNEECCGNFFILLCGGIVAFPYKKFGAVYLCKRYQSK